MKLARMVAALAAVALVAATALPGKFQTHQR
jgi:hypothetical protein